MSESHNHHIEDLSQPITAEHLDRLLADGKVLIAALYWRNTNTNFTGERYGLHFVYYFRS
jgi:hypothetical protein